MSKLTLRIQLHLLIVIHKIFYRRYKHRFQITYDGNHGVNSEYHKQMFRLLKKKESLLTNDEKKYVFKKAYDLYYSN